MNYANELPILEFLESLTEIFAERLVDSFHLPIRPERAHQSWNRIDYQPDVAFTITQCLFGMFTVFNVDIRAKPLYDLSSGVSHRIGAEDEPAIYAIEAPHSRLGVDRRARCQASLPILHQRSSVIWVDSISPSPTPCFVSAHSRIFKPASIQEFAVAVRARRPSVVGIVSIMFENAF